MDVWMYVWVDGQTDRQMEKVQYEEVKICGNIFHSKLHVSILKNAAMNLCRQLSWLFVFVVCNHCQQKQLLLCSKKSIINGPPLKTTGDECLILKNIVFQCSIAYSDLPFTMYHIFCESSQNKRLRSDFLDRLISEVQYGMCNIAYLAVCIGQMLYKAAHVQQKTWRETAAL